jgi:hypothetical protein
MSSSRKRGSTHFVIESDNSDEACWEHFIVIARKDDEAIFSNDLDCHASNYAKASQDKSLNDKLFIVRT